MKYGETLRQRSIPAWSHHNIDYDSVKSFIKEQTTPGQGKTVSIPGGEDEKLIEFENALYLILQDQHTRIDLFVKSKAGEIRRRVDHARKLLKQLAARKIPVKDSRIPIRWLERYSRLENDLLKAGEEIKSLARFTSTQRTAFRKLLKKYKKWTDSPNLEKRFREDVLEEPTSFVRLDLGPLLDDYSETLQNIRALYEARLRQSTSAPEQPTSPTAAVLSSTERLQTNLTTKSNVDFDTAIATIPLGEEGSLAHYFIHQDNVVELQVLLLQHLEYYTARSRSNSTVLSGLEPEIRGASHNSDYFTLIADDLDRFARNQSAATINEREHLPGLPPQRAKVAVRWNNDEDAVVSTRSGSSNIHSASVKRKHIDAIFDPHASFPKSKEVDTVKSESNMANVRDEILKDGTIRPLYRISSCRSRFVGLKNGPKGMTLATLDTNISMRKNVDDSGLDFPFAVLHIRQEGPDGSETVSTLDRSHLVERVRGFSLQYHALWQIYEPKNIAPPFWIPILSRDIRKLPPPAIKSTTSSAAGSSGTQSATHRSGSLVDGTTAVETAGQSSSTLPEQQLEMPPLRSFRKKRRRAHAEMQLRQKYWSEYDNPENVQNEDSFVIYCNPNEKSTFDRIFDKLAAFVIGHQPEEEALLPSPAVPEDDESSSDEEAVPRRKPASYGTVVPRPTTVEGSFLLSAQRHDHNQFLPAFTAISFVASVAILIVAYVLAETSKHKYATEADAGILFAIGCSLMFAMAGCVPLFTRRGYSWLSLGFGVTTLILVAVCSGGLVARMLG